MKIRKHRKGMKITKREDSDESSTGSESNDSVFINYDPLAYTEDSQEPLLDKIEIEPVNAKPQTEPFINNKVEHLPPKSPKSSENQKNQPRKSVRIIEEVPTANIPMKIRFNI